MAEAIRGQQRIHKLPKLSVFFVVCTSSFYRDSEGGNNNKKKAKQMVSQISYCLFVIVFLLGIHGPVQTVVRGAGP